MEIIITHCRYAPKWDSLQTVIQEATNEPEGELRRIARHDKECNYREPGVYSLGFVLSNGCTLPITLNVIAVGK